ncbi:hypothetical protein PTTG_27406 [Puccinia triticina 1-1 BBBD Race 1]|uniref:Uncharacterized protein n=1 Tax=Puccinia triticina (isolate 1-1 / race 1 (BBBD)) TaxID=630390 RepID=A0A180GKE0_PUCT1|nr:hypothetical protein PTTG_27406 [Puccinia triticina 1-1 BBBD Race 1]
MDNCMVGRGDMDLFERSYYAQKPSPKNYKKRNSGAISLLLSVVSNELHHKIQVHETFLDAWNALATACGKDSVVVICKKLFELLSLEFEPQSSLQAHISKFKSLYTELTAWNTSVAEVKKNQYTCLAQKGRDVVQVDPLVVKALSVEDVADTEELHLRFIQTHLKPLNNGLLTLNKQLAHLHHWKIHPYVCLMISNTPRWHLSLSIRVLINNLTPPTRGSI